MGTKSHSINTPSVKVTQETKTASRSRAGASVRVLRSTNVTTLELDNGGDDLAVQSAVQTSLKKPPEFGQVCIGCSTNPWYAPDKVREREEGTEDVGTGEPTKESTIIAPTGPTRTRRLPVPAHRSSGPPSAKTESESAQVEAQEPTASRMASTMDGSSGLAPMSTDQRNGSSAIDSCPDTFARPHSLQFSDSIAGPPDRSRDLLSNIITKFSPKTMSKHVVGMCREDAQVMADFLSAILTEEGILSADEGNRILVILCKLATSARVYPQRFILKTLEYEVRPMATGGFATVHKGRYNGESVCVKLIINKVDEKECIKELILWAHLSHPNILPFYGVFSEDSGILVSPWMGNGTLREYSSKLPQASRMSLICDVIDGLLYLHKLNIVHSDIKGENILVSDQGRAFITDFGISHIATAAARQKLTSSLIGHTRHWAPPEAFDQDPEVPIRPAKAQDVWSFGCLCYEVLSRKPPYHQYRCEHQLMAAIIGGELPLRPQLGCGGWDYISDQMWGLMKICWSHTPGDRPTFQHIRSHFAEMGFQHDRSNVPGDIRDALILGGSVELDESRVVRILLNLLSRIDAASPTVSTTLIQQQPPTTHSPGASWEPLDHDPLLSQQSQGCFLPALAPDSLPALVTIGTPAPRPPGPPGTYVPPHTSIPNSVVSDHGETQPGEQQPAPYSSPGEILDVASALPSHPINAPFVQLFPIAEAQTVSTVQELPILGSEKRSSSAVRFMIQDRGGQVGVPHSPTGVTEMIPLRRPQCSSQSPEPALSLLQPPPSSAPPSPLIPTFALSADVPLAKGRSQSHTQTPTRSLSATSNTITCSARGGDTNIGMDIPTEKLRSEDIIIACVFSTDFTVLWLAGGPIRVMGPTGTGKSHFIDVLTRQPGARSGHALESHTSEVRSTILEKYEGKRSLVLVDTPGFDDTNKTDMEILDTISKWLEETYRKKIKLTGILYLHRITDNRMAGTPLRNLRMFGEICGDVAMGRVALVTTMWDKLRQPEIGTKREYQLRETFWKGMLEKGSTIARFDNTPNGAEEIIQGLIVEKKKQETLLLQEELVDLKRRLNETHAGRMLYSTLQRLLDGQKNAIEKLIVQIEAQADTNPQLIERLRKEQEKIEKELEETLDGVQRLKVTLSRRILLFFFGKRGKIRALSESESGSRLAVMR